MLLTLFYRKIKVKEDKYSIYRIFVYKEGETWVEDMNFIFTTWWDRLGYLFNSFKISVPFLSMLCFLRMLGVKFHGKILMNFFLIFNFFINI